MSAAAVPRRTALLAAVAVLVAVFVTAAAGAPNSSTSFAPSGLISAGGYACSFALAKLDGDENLDLAATNCREDVLTIWLGDGAGHFRRAGAPVKVGDLPNTVAAADFNDDGRTDLAVGGNQSKDIGILLGDGGGGFTKAPDSPIHYARSPGRLASGDLNRDGHVDLVVPGYPSRLAILLGDGTGRFALGPGSPLTVGGQYGPQRADIADFNADGKLDVAASTKDPMMISILLGDGAGGFRALTTIRAGLKDVADFNGDGRPDLAVATKASTKAPYSAKVLLGTASGRFSPAPGLRVAGQFWITEGVAGDFDGDRKLDLALSSDGVGRMSLLSGDGRGRLRSAPDAQFALPEWADGGSDLTPADLDHDGALDLVVTTRRFESRGGERGLAVLWNVSSPPRAVPSSFPQRRDAVFSTRAPIWQLAADGTRAAAVTGRGPCGRLAIVVWRAPGRRSSTIKENCIGDVVAQLAVGGGQVAWLILGGGNDLEQIIRAAPVSGGKRREIEFTTNGNRAGGDPRGFWLGRLLGGGSVLAYDGWLLTCDDPEHGCDQAGTKWIVKEQRLVRIVGRRKVVVKRGPAARGLAAVGRGRMAVETDGAVNVLTAGGRSVATVAPVADDPPRAVTLSRARLAVLRTFTLDVYSPTSGKQLRSIPLGSAASMQLAGMNEQLALLQSPRRLVLVRLRDGKLSLLAPRTKSHVDAKLTAAGLFYAYNVPRGRSRGRIVFEPTRRLLARF